MKKVILLVVMAVMIVVCFSVSIFAADAALKVTRFDGKVLIKIFPSTDWVDVKPGQDLNPNDVIRTGDNSHALLEFSDKSTIALKSNTEISVEELIWDNVVKTVGLNMPIGEMRVVIKKVGGPSSFKVKTPTATCGARGTIFYIMTDGVQTRVFVAEGSVDFANPISGETYVVVRNMASITDLSGTVSEPRELAGEEREKALAGWDGVIAEPYTEPAPEKGGEGADVQTQEGTPENPATDNKYQQENPTSPV